MKAIARQLLNSEGVVWENRWQNEVCGSYPTAFGKPAPGPGVVGLSGRWVVGLLGLFGCWAVPKWLQNASAMAPGPNAQRPGPNAQPPGPNAQHPGPNLLQKLKIPFPSWEASWEPKALILHETYSLFTAKTMSDNRRTNKNATSGGERRVADLLAP